MAPHTYVERPPSAPLAGLVASVWEQHVATDGAPHRHRDIPSGAVEIVWREGGTPQVIGPLTRPRFELLAPATSIVGVRLHPGVLGGPAPELVDLVVPAHDVWGGPPDLGERVDAAALERYVLERVQARHDPLVSEVVRQLRRRRDDVAALRASLHISERQLRRRTQAAVGLPPKPLQRILRFQRFVALAQHAIAHDRSPVDDGLAAIAATVGYADQAHLSRECRELTGVTPRAWLAETEAVCGCGHDHAASYAPVLQALPA